MNNYNTMADYANIQRKSCNMPPRPGLPKPGVGIFDESQTSGHQTVKTPPCVKGGDPDERPSVKGGCCTDPNYSC